MVKIADIELIVVPICYCVGTFHDIRDTRSIQRELDRRRLTVSLWKNSSRLNAISHGNLTLLFRMNAADGHQGRREHGNSRANFVTHRPSSFLCVSWAGNERPAYFRVLADRDMNHAQRREGPPLQN